MAIAGLLAFVLLAGVSASAGAQSFDQPDRVRVSTSGNDSELVQSLPITTTPGAWTPVMSLPFKGQPLLDGDGLRPSSELEVTTDCTVQMDSCVGTAYSYNPSIDTRLVLTSSTDNTGSDTGAVQLDSQTGRTCTHEQHHCMVVFPFPDYPSFVASSTANPPCVVAGNCVLKVFARVYSPDAQPSNYMIVGDNEPGCCGLTAQDKGRVNAVRLRPDVAGPDPVGQVTTYSTTSQLVGRVPVKNTVSEGKTVVLSQPLASLKRNEQLAVSANLTADISSLRYNRVLINSRLILAGSRTATSPGSVPKDVEELKGEIAEANGFNCTQNQPVASENTNPCLFRKTGVAHLIDNAGVQLYVNLVVSATPARSVAQVQPNEWVTVSGGSLKVVRYPASRYG